ncbi:MAG: hypothetical protein Q9207_007085, partial [Kuettlingeria erythrocarpa]
GKHKPIWDPSTDCGDYVVATGCNDMLVTGRKKEQKLYYKQTTRPGALKSLNMESMMRKWGGGEILKRAVRGMLPKNRLRDKRLERLKGEFLLFSFPRWRGIGLGRWEMGDGGWEIGSCGVSGG